MGPELRQSRGVPGHDGEPAVPCEPGDRRDPPRRHPLHLEGAGHRLPEPAPGTYPVPDAADGDGDRLPRRAAAGGGGHGARQGGPLFRHHREARVPHAL